MFKDWQLAAMEDYGLTDTGTGLINRVARRLAESPNDVIGTGMLFEDAEILEAPDAGAKSLALLELTDISGRCGSVTLALDSDAHLVLAMDRRSALTISSLDALAGWIEITTEAVRSVRQSLADNFPAAEDA